MSFIYFLTGMFPAVFLGELNPESVFMYLGLLLFVVVLVVILLIVRNFKKNFVDEINALKSKLILLKDHNETILKEQKILTNELSVLLLKVVEVENELSKCIEEKKKLEQEYQSLNDRIQNPKTNNDIIIEYYTNDKSGE